MRCDENDLRHFIRAIHFEYNEIESMKTIQIQFNKRKTRYVIVKNLILELLEDEETDKKKEKNYERLLWKSLKNQNCFSCIQKRFNGLKRQQKLIDRFP